MQEVVLEGAIGQHEAPRRARKRMANDLARCVSKIVRLVEPELVIEIGAHEASFSKRIKARLPEARVVAFEANPMVYDTHKEAVAAAGVEFRHQCVCSENRICTFSVPIKGNGERITMGSLLFDSKARNFTSYEVQGTRLDDFLGDHTGEIAMWIDVEGAIGVVLDGAQAALRNCRVLFAEMESKPRWPGQRLTPEIVEYLAHYGLFPILRDVQRRKWQHNILFMREDDIRSPAIQRVCVSFLARQLRARGRLSPEDAAKVKPQVQDFTAGSSPERSDG